MEFSAKQASALIKAKSYEEFSAVLAGFAKVSEEEAKGLFDKFHGACPELSDEKLAAVTGGAMYDQNGREVKDYWYDTDGVNPSGDKGVLYVLYADKELGIYDGLLPDFTEVDSRGNDMIGGSEAAAIRAA